MKLYPLLSGLALSTVFISYANADITRGTARGAFTNIYATDVDGHKRMTHLDSLCAWKNWYLLRDFYVNFKIDDTNATPQLAEIKFRSEVSQLSGTQDATTGKYELTSSKLSDNLKDLDVEKMTFTLDNDLWHAKAKLVFMPSGGWTADCKHPLTCWRSHHRVEYRCVVSTD